MRIRDEGKEADEDEHGDEDALGSRLFLLPVSFSDAIFCVRFARRGRSRCPERPREELEVLSMPEGSPGQVERARM